MTFPSKAAFVCECAMRIVSTWYGESGLMNVTMKDIVNEAEQLAAELERRGLASWQETHD